jgi:hypothetical protein
MYFCKLYFGVSITHRWKRGNYDQCVKVKGVGVTTSGLWKVGACKGKKCMDHIISMQNSDAVVSYLDISSRLFHSKMFGFKDRENPLPLK